MEIAYERFRTNLKNSKNITAIYENLLASKIPIDFDDLLRWQWVQSVSALDKYVHDAIVAGMLQIYNKRRYLTPKFKAYPTNMELLIKVKDSETGIIELEKEWIRQLATKSFQNPTNITDGLSLIWLEDHKWSKIAQEMRKIEKEVKQELSNISIRRNQIVHQGDFPTESSDRQTISFQDILDVHEFIELLGSAINSCIQDPQNLLTGNTWKTN